MVVPSGVVKCWQCGMRLTQRGVGLTRRGAGLSGEDGGCGLVAWEG